jgi:photosystem II stability/assembly factor-like uncharacterized protein
VNERCSLNLSPETLSAWRSHALPVSEQQTIAGHVPDCQVCQRILSRFERIALAVRTPPSMPSQDDIWYSVSATIASNRNFKLIPIQGRLPLISFGAAAILVSLFASLILILAQHHGPTQTPSATSTPSISPTITSTVTLTPSPTETITIQRPGTSGLIANSGLGYVHMIDTTTGWAINNLKVYLTTDAGTTWHNVTPNGVNAAGMILTMLDATTAWMSDGQKIYRTTDAGQVWQSASPPIQSAVPPATGINSLIFVDANHGWAVDRLDSSAGHQYLNLLRTTDGGVTWTQVTTTDGPGGLPSGAHKTDPAFLNTTTGWIGTDISSYGGSSTYMYVTHDGGVTWQSQALSPPSQGFAGQASNFTFFDASNGALSLTDPGGTTAYNYVTHDGGVTWNAAGTPASNSYSAPFFLDASRWWALDKQNNSHNLAVTSDGGLHWATAVSGGALNDISHVSFISPTVGWAWGKALLRTTDGGSTWQQITYQATG